MSTPISNLPTRNNLAQRKSILTEEYRALRLMKKNRTESLEELSNKYGISSNTIRCVISDKKYAQRYTKKTTNEPKNT